MSAETVSTTRVPDVGTMVELLRTMIRIREFETAAGKLMAEGKLPGFLHLSIGQEAVAAGVCDALESDDYMTTTHRGHGHCIAKGGELDRMMSELFGRADGYCKGRSGSMHIADPTLGILGANAIVGAGIPIAVGAALTAQVRSSGHVAVAFFGEGAVAEGTFHESMNLASLWKLPVIFVCENNLYAELTPVSVHLKPERVSDLAGPFRIPGVTVDGNDILAVREAALDAVERARAGHGPTLLECLTYRWHGHFEGDPQRYRTPNEVEEWKARDPIELWVKALTEAGIAPSEIAAIKRAAAKEVDAAIEHAQQQPPAPGSSLTDDVYHVPVKA